MTFKEKIKSTPYLGALAERAGDLRRKWRKKLRNWLFYRRNRKFLLQNSELKNRHKGERCFIIATGPSVKLQDLKPLKNELCISVSNAFVHPDYRTFAPRYHIFTATHVPVTYEQLLAWLTDGERVFSENQEIFVALLDREFVERSKVLTKQKVRYYTSTSVKEIRPRGRDVDFTRMLPEIQTVTHWAIYLACYMGCSEIYLIGCDHDSILHLGETRHFYEPRDSAIERLGYNEWYHQDWEKVFRSYASLWRKYKKIQAYCLRRGIKIMNATPGSLLDVFPRVKLEEVLRTPKPTRR